MLNIEIICLGKLKESYLKLACAEYQKRLSKYCRLTITELPDEKLPSTMNEKLKQEIKEKEACRIKERLKKDSYVFALDLKGKEYSSEQFSEKLSSLGVYHTSHITFLIGGTLGFTEEILSSAQETLCFSKMTFPHPLIRVFLLEQLFRAFKIQKKETYHW